MHRPLRVPFYLRLWNLIKGLLLRNTVDWQKASDGLNMPSLSRHERESKRPKANLDIIKPREKPRARLDTFRGAQISQPEPPPTPEWLTLPTEVSAPEETEASSSQVERPEGTYIKKRRYKRKRGSGGSGGSSFLRRVFGK